MYFVDREKIELTLQYLEENMSIFTNRMNWQSKIEKKALERIAQMMIEAILDVGTAMIDGFIMRDPGSYEDIIDILEDEKVINGNDASSLRKVIQVRKLVVQGYLHINHEELVTLLSANLQSIAGFINAIREYLENPGPVSTFR